MLERYMEKKKMKEAILLNKNLKRKRLERPEAPVAKGDINAQGTSHVAYSNYAPKQNQDQTPLAESNVPSQPRLAIRGEKGILKVTGSPLLLTPA